jgi:hypothetical protein
MERNESEREWQVNPRQAEVDRIRDAAARSLRANAPRPSDAAVAPPRTGERESGPTQTPGRAD